ncbi:MAG: helix-turn-helix domain-containing protein [Mycolicibacterium sp.]|nr:helix-turn-helix domain-containing protein [Mycolicibacterium sp.]
MVTVEVDPVRVESRLAAGELRCPSCPDGVLAGWGFARSRRVMGLADPVRPRRSRCRGCAVTHVLLPVSLLLRRAYSAELIWAVLKAKAAGEGHRRIATAVGIPGCTVRRWLRVLGRRAEAVRQWFLSVAVSAGVDVSIPAATGTPLGDVVAAVGAARSAVVSRFGVGLALGAVTAVAVAVACSGARLLSPGWPTVRCSTGATPFAP